MNTHTTGTPADTAGGLYYKTPVTPEEAFVAIGRLRREARDEIERLLNFLDDTENHMELEPSLGWPEPTTVAQLGPLGATDDREAEPEHDEDGADDEPSLGSSNDHHGTGTRYDPGSMTDGEGPDTDLEPSLGSFNDVHGYGTSYHGDDRDLEGDRSDDEPSLGWTEQFGRGEGGLWGGHDDKEECIPVDDMPARERFLASRLEGDGTAGVTVERTHMRQLCGLSDRQRKLVGPRVNRRKVTI